MSLSVQVTPLDPYTLRVGVYDSVLGAIVPFQPGDLTAVTFTVTGDGSAAPVPQITDSPLTDSATAPKFVYLTFTVPAVPNIPYSVVFNTTFNTPSGQLVSPTGTFTGPALKRYETYKALLPSTVYNVDGNKTLNGLIIALAYIDEQLGGPEKKAATRQLRFGTALDTAQGYDLDRSANSYGVARLGTFGDDDTFRQLAKVVAVVPKTILKVFKDVLDATVGTGYFIFEINPGEVIIELPLSSTQNSASLQHATYLHAGATVPSTTSPPDATTFYGDYLMSDPSVVGPPGRSVVLYSPSARQSDIVTILKDVKAAGVVVTIVQRTS